MIKQLIIAAAALAPLAANATLDWSLQGKAYTVDTLYHTTIGPGTTQTSLRLNNSSSPLRVSYTTVDLTNPYVTVRTLQAKQSLTGGATLTNMVNSNKSADCQIIGGTNADFFSGSQPVGTAMVNGDYYRARNNWWHHFGITADKVPYVGELTFGGTVTSPGGASHTLTAINESRLENYLVIYNSHWGSNTGTNAYGSEVTIKPVDGSTLAPGQTGRFQVVAAPNVAGSMTIPSDGFVLSGHGTGRDFVNSLAAGDVISVETHFTTESGASFAPYNVAGGQPVILRDGVVLNTQDALDHLTSLNPRTAVGYSADKTKVVLLVVDGRWAGNSVGCVSKVLADIMKYVGCADALNFDGGGSSMLWTCNRGIVNKPSDGSERAVVNGVFAVSNTPTDKEVAKIEFVDYNITLPRYGIYKPLVNTYNKYGVWIGTATPQLSCPDALGYIGDDGTALYAVGTGYHALTATYAGVSCTMPVTIGQGEPQFRLSSVLLDDTYAYTAELEALVGDNMMAVGNAAFDWSSADASIATVDAEGVIRGVANGTTTITGTAGSLSRDLQVVVQIAPDRFMEIDPLTAPDSWTSSKSNVTINSIAVGANGGFDISYTINASRAPSMAISKEITLWSRPDAIAFHLDPGSSTISSVKFTYSCNGARNAVATFDVSSITSPQELQYDWSSAFDKLAVESYPLVISKIQFALPTTSGVSNKINFRDLKSVYASKPSSGVECVGVAADGADGPVEYFNLQGIRLAEPQPGQLVIRRQGGVSTKIIVR